MKRSDEDKQRGGGKMKDGRDSERISCAIKEGESDVKKRIVSRKRE